MLGDLQRGVESRVKSGGLAPASDVSRAAVRTPDCKEAAIDDWLRRRVDEAFADPSPAVPAEEVFARLRNYRAGRRKDRRE
jgi:antitoxin ParD1/3/4